MSEQQDGDANRLWFRMLRLNASMNVAITERLREFGLSIPQCDVLSTLTEREGVTQQELAERLYVTKGNISGLIDRLVAAGLVERRSTESDRRSHSVYLTGEGHRLAHLAIEAQRRFVLDVFGAMSAKDIAQFETLVIATRNRVREISEATAGGRAVKDAYGNGASAHGRQARHALAGEVRQRTINRDLIR